MGAGASIVSLVSKVFQAVIGISCLLQTACCVGHIGFLLPALPAEIDSFRHFLGGGPNWRFRRISYRRSASPTSSLRFSHPSPNGRVSPRRLTQYASNSWRAFFYFSAGVACLIIVCAVIFIPADRAVQDSNRSVDWVGAALITSGLVLLTFTLAGGEGAPNGVRTLASSSLSRNTIC